MSKRFVVLAILAAFVLAIFAASAFGKAKYDEREKVLRERTDKITAYSFPKYRRKPVAWGDVPDPSNTIEHPVSSRRPLGVAQSPTGAASPGFVVVNSYNDDQQFPGGNRQVDFRGDSAWIHFVYGNAGSPDGLSQTGYNVYNAHGGDWPRGAGVGVTVQPTDQEGLWPSMDVTPKGFVVIGTIDDAGGSLENHFYWQASRFSGFFNAGSQIDPSQYSTNFLTSTNYLAQPRVEVQVWAGDTITHVIAVESAYTVLKAGNPFDIRGNTINYFHRIGTAQVGGTWFGPVTIDTMNSSSGVQDISNGSITASRVTPEVAVAYTHQHEQGIIHNQRYDVEVYFRRSDSIGMSWNPPVNMTNYSRIEPSQTAFIATNALFDSENGLHIIWYANNTPADVYDDPIYFWGDFSGSIYHWTDRVAGPNAGGTIVKAHNADWGIDYNTQVCGFGAPGVGYVGYESIAECDGRMYITFSQWLDALGNWDYGPEIDDCASGGFSDRYYAANAEIGMVVSSSLDGLLWDAARNLTDTYTPDCDSAGFGGVCMNDGRATLSRFGMDVSQYGSLTWPGGELVDPTPADSPAYSGTHFLHLLYTEDHFPSPGWRNPEIYGEVTLNPLKWMRIPCVNPIEAPQIAVSENVIGYPDYVNHGKADTMTITVTNDGNVPLTVSEIGTFEDAGGPSNWLATTQSSLNVGAGVNNTATFDVILNDGGTVNTPGTIVALNGSIFLKSDAANSDSLSIEVIDFLVADSVIGLEFDTVATSITSLIVSNTGEMGYNGNNNNGELNLDYFNDGDCNAQATVYLYSGGPMVTRVDVDGVDTTFVHSQAMFQNEFSTDQSFKRVLNTQSSSKITDPDFDGFFTGTAVNFDSTIGMERTYYAPTTGGDSSDFVIVKTQIFSMDASPQGPLAIAEAIDWDIPGGTGAEAVNLSGVVPGHEAVYQQGVDTTTDPLCQPNANRFGTTMLLGYYLQSELSEDPCAGVCSPYGAFANRNDSLFEYDDSLQPAYFWKLMGENTGANAESSGEETDLHMVMTYVYDYDLPAADTFTVFSVVSSVHNGDANELAGNLDAAFEWYRVHLRPGCEQLCGCCVGITGNVDGDAGELTDIGDLTALIAYLYIPPNPVPTCPEEANIDGDSEGLIDIGDLTALIAYLYIPPNPEPAPCQ
jgi:hypothetical protein